MLVETFVLQGHKGISQMLWNQIPVIDLDAVGIDADVLVNLVSFTVVDYGCLTGSHYIAEMDFGGGSQNALKGAEAGGNAADHDADHGGKAQFHKGNSQLAPPFF